MILKFNVGETKNVVFHEFAQGKEIPPTREGYGTQFLYSVQVNGEDCLWYATANANKILQDNNLQVGDVVTITKAAEKQYVYVKAGQVLLPKAQGSGSGGNGYTEITNTGAKIEHTHVNVSQPVQNAPTGQPDALKAKLLEMSKAFQELTGRVSALESIVLHGYSAPSAIADAQDDVQIADIPF